MILKNVTALGVSSVVDRLLAMVAGIFARRALGPAAIGAYSWSVAVASYPALVVNAGLGTIAKRDVARDPPLATRYVGLLLASQFLLAVAASLLVAALALVVDQPVETRILLALQIIGLLLIPLDFSWLLYASERMAALAPATIVLGVVRTALIILLVRSPADVFLYALIAFPLQLLLSLWELAYAVRVGVLDWRALRLQLRGAGNLLRQSLPIALSSLTSMLYFNSDLIILGATQSARQVGLYSSAYSLMMTPMVLIVAVNNSFFPSLSRAANVPAEARRVSMQFLKVMLWMGCSFAALGWGIGRHVVTLLYGVEFFQAGIYFEWLALNLALLFFDAAYIGPLRAWGGQQRAFVATAFAAVFNVAANLVLLPQFGAPAAIVTTLASEFLVLCVGVLMRRAYHPINWLKPTLLAVVVCGAAALAARSLSDAGYWVLAGALACAVLGVGMLALERSTIRALLNPAAPRGDGNKPG